MRYLLPLGVLIMLSGLGYMFYGVMQSGAPLWAQISVFTAGTTLVAGMVVAVAPHIWFEFFD